jgi:hypothetical protein
MNDRDRDTVIASDYADEAGVEYHPPPNTSDEPQPARTFETRQRSNVTSKTVAPNTSETRPIGCRVDALVIAFKLELDPRVAQLLEERAKAAAEASSAELELVESSFALKASRRQSFLSFQNADIRGAIDGRATDGYRLELIARATYLATNQLPHVIDELFNVAAEFGQVIDVPRLRRFDCAADFVGFPLTSTDAERFLTKRSKIAEFRAEEKDFDEVHTALSKPAMTAHRACTRKVTGFGVSAGNPISARIYDKTAELLVPGRELKREIEHARWRALGWNGDEPVTRVEFQHTGKFIDEIRLRDPAKLIANLDGVWQHDCQWFRVVDPASASRLYRCKLDSRWEAVIRTQFSHTAGAVERTRVRGGATLPHMLGTTLSRLSAARQIDRIPLALRHTGEVVNEREFADSMSPTEAKAFVVKLCEYIYSNAAVDTAANYGLRHGWNEAVYQLMTKHNAAVARFWSSDDRKKKVQSVHPLIE